jgi:osmotically-inducible protein OsmY
MIKHCLLAAGLVFAVACEKRETPPTPAERQAATAAETEWQQAEANRERAERRVEVAEEKKDLAEEHAEAAEDKAEEMRDRVGDRAAADWKGPDEGWRDEWVTFAGGRDRTVEKGDYVIERDNDGSISAWRKVKQVSGEAYGELKDAALVTQVKAKLAADEDTRALDINVDAEDHTVRLRGTVRSAAEAAEAVRIALSTPGTEKVVSHLKWDGATTR